MNTVDGLRQVKLKLNTIIDSLKQVKFCMKTVDGLKQVKLYMNTENCLEHEHSNSAPNVTDSLEMMFKRVN